MAYDPSNETEEASALLVLARQTHEAHVAAAKKKAIEIVARAEAEANTILSNAREEFEWLQAKIAEHRDFEVRYREALKSYLSELLNEVSTEDEFIAPAGLVTEETSAFAVAEDDDDEDERIEEAAAQAAQVPVFEAPEPVIAPEPVYSASVEEPEAPAEEPSTEAITFAEETDGYEVAPVAVEESYEVPEFEQGEAPVPSFNAPEPEPFEAVSDDDPSDDLPEVPENLDSYGSEAGEIRAYDAEVEAETEAEDAQQGLSFDELINTEPKPATDSVVTQAPLFDEDEEDGDRKVKGFFGFNKR